jgi:hypothetical protein
MEGDQRMLTITVLGQELYNEETGEFFTKDDVVLNLEHSLVSLSKWESIWEVPFLGKGERTPEQLFSYVECMCLHAVSSPDVFTSLSSDNLEAINKYLDSKQSATTISEVSKASSNREIITSELIYYWMVNYNIPSEYQYWNLNRLFNLIRIAGVKNTKPKKMSRSEMAARNRELNAQRRQQMGTSG